MIKSLILFLLITVLYYSKCTHIVSVDEDFNKVKTDAELEKYVEEIMVRLRMFKVPVHPRIRLFYELLKRGMEQYAARTADTIYVPHKYNTHV